MNSCGGLWHYSRVGWYVGVWGLRYNAANGVVPVAPGQMNG